VRRRRFLAGSLLWLVGLVVAPLSARRARGEVSSLHGLLEHSPYVYVSPLRSDGSESHCHAEVWYAWLDEAIVMIVSADRWKARAIARGLAKARIWVGDHGRWKGLIWNNERFRAAPSFEARGERVEDAALLERLLGAYETKYPDEIAQWRDRMRTGYADGSRVLVRYHPTFEV
jgi:hypothetical protein